jgi:hypothetical protein
LIEGGIDQSLIDTAPSSSALLLRVLTAAESCFRDNVEDAVVLNVEMFVMALCPFCASKMHRIADQIACDVDCSQHTDGKMQSVGLDFQVHYVGIINNDTSIAAVHGSVEVKLIVQSFSDFEQLDATKVEICIRNAYAQHYHYLRFLHCVDRNISLVPYSLVSCATEADVDFPEMQKCATQDVKDFSRCC